MSNDEIISLKQEIESCEHDIEIADKLSRLKENPLFRELILELFCKELLVTNTQLSLVTRLPEPVRENARNRANAGAVLLSWFNELENIGETAKNTKHEAQNRINEIIANPSNDDE